MRMDAPKQCDLEMIVRALVSQEFCPYCRKVFFKTIIFGMSGYQVQKVPACRVVLECGATSERIC